MRVLLCILLKVVEIGVVVIIPYFVGKWDPLKIAPCEEGKLNTWFFGLAHFLIPPIMIFLAFVVCCLLYFFICANWQLAGKILGG